MSTAFATLRTVFVKVLFNLGIPGETKKSQTGKNEVVKATGCDNDAVNVTKKLFAKNPRWDAVKTANNAVRAYINSITTYWGEKGVRLLRVERIDEFTKALDSLKMNWEIAKDNFVLYYDDIIRDSLSKLAGIGNRSDYKHGKKLANAFKCGFKIEMLPDNSFSGIYLDSDILKRMETEAADAEKLAIESAVTNIVARVYKAVHHVFDKLSDPKAIFHKTSLEKLDVLRELLADFTELSPEFQVLSDELGKLCGHDAKELRTNEAYRKQVVEDAESIVKKMESAFGECVFADVEGEEE